jgi:hypothetical protein
MTWGETKVNPRITVAFSCHWRDFQNARETREIIYLYWTDFDKRMALSTKFFCPFRACPGAGVFRNNDYG